MDIIKSKENRLFKELTKLEIKKFRDKNLLFKIEGANLVREAVDCGVELVSIVVNEENAGEEVNTIVERAISKCAQINSVYLSAQLFKKISDTVNSQGIIAVAKQRRLTEKEFFEGSEGKNFVVLDSVQDPGNVGTILRTAEAAGYAGVISAGDSADVYSPKVVRACAGTLFRLPVLKMDKICEAIEILKSKNKKIVSLDMNGERAYFEVKLCNDIALVLGNEGNGISEDAQNASDMVIKIPMQGQIESLNVAVSAAIVMYENMRA